jgi:hypothetical protein
VEREPERADCVVTNVVTDVYWGPFAERPDVSQRLACLPLP